MVPALGPGQAPGPGPERLLVELVIFSGCPGAGKTTFYTTTFLHTHVRISLDMLKTRRREALLAQACIATKLRLVIDNTNPTRDDRAKYIDWARGSRFRVIGYTFESTMEGLVARNAVRTGRARVPVAVIHRIFETLETLTFAEGFDRLFRVHAEDHGRFHVEEDHHEE